MRASVITSTAVAAVFSLLNVASAADAPVVQNNPSNVTYEADFTDQSKIHGTVSFTGNTNGTGVVVKVDLSGFPSTGGPFIYHVHEFRVPDNGNCTAAGAHLDPYNRTETPACDPTQPQTCQIGDLSGKHGKIPDNTTNYTITYTDLYADVIPSTPAFVGNLSVVIHAANKTRLACANINAVTANGTTNGTAPGANSTSPASPSKTPNAAVGNVAGGLTVAAMVGVVSFFLL